MRQSVAEYTPAEFLDVFTHDAIMEDPVRAMDGKTYSRKNIERHFKECLERGEPCISPISRQIIEQTLVVDEEMNSRIRAFKNCHSADGYVDCSETASTCSHRDDATTIEDKPIKFIGHISSVMDLNHIFSKLDALRPILNKALVRKNWLPPNFSVVGGENGGKSTLLERIGLLSLLPRDEEFCTRVPILVQLRHSDKRVAPTLEVIDLKTNQPIQPSYTITIDMGHIDVRKEMEEIVKKYNGKLEGVVEDKMIVLTVESPDVPSLNLMDLPGLVMTASSSQPADMSMRAQNIVKNLVTKHGEHTLYLVVIPGQTALNMDIGLKVIMDNKISHRTLGVITKCDELPTRNAATVIQNRTKGTGSNHIELAPHGYVCVANPVVFADIGESNFHAMKRQAQAECQTFVDLGLKDMWDDRTVGTGALIDRMNSMFLEYMRKTWIGYMIDLLKEERRLVSSQNRDLGLPASHDSNQDESAEELVYPSIAAYDAIRESFLSSIDGRVESVVLTSLKRNILEILQKAGANKPKSFRLVQDHLDDLNAALNKAAGTHFSGLKSLWVDEFCNKLRKDTSMFKLGRFDMTIKRIEEMLQQVFKPFEDKFLWRIKECIGHHTSIPSTSTIHINYCADGSIVLQMNEYDIMSHICHVVVGECCSSLLKHYESLSFKKYAHELEVEACVEERRILAKKLDCIDEALLHMQSLARDIACPDISSSSSSSAPFSSAETDSYSHFHDEEAVLPPLVTCADEEAHPSGGVDLGNGAEAKHEAEAEVEAEAEPEAEAEASLGESYYDVQPPPPLSPQQTDDTVSEDRSCDDRDDAPPAAQPQPQSPGLDDLTNIVRVVSGGAGTTVTCDYNGAVLAGTGNVAVKVDKGINIWVLTMADEDVTLIAFKNFNTSGKLSASGDLVKFINELPQNQIVCLAVHVDCKVKLSQAALDAMTKLGANADVAVNLKAYSSFALIGKKGLEPGRAVQQIKDSSAGNSCVAANCSILMYLD